MSTCHIYDTDKIIFPILIPPGYSASIEKIDLELDLAESGRGFRDSMKGGGVLTSRCITTSKTKLCSHPGLEGGSILMSKSISSLGASS